jgi:spermidine synthase
VVITSQAEATVACAAVANFEINIVCVPISDVPPKPKTHGGLTVIRAFCNLVVAAFFGSLALPPLAILSTIVNAGRQISPDMLHAAEVYGAFALAMAFVSYRLLGKIAPYLQTESRNQAAFLEGLPDSYLAFAIIASAGLSLLLELAIIRWHGTVFEFFAFYKNYGLLACFAGLGLGYAVSRHESGIPLSLTLPLLAWQFVLLIVLRFGLLGPASSLATTPFREQLSMGVQAASPSQIGAVYLLLAVVFLLTALAFIPVGQLCGKLMERKSQLSAYGLNLLGSLLGVLLMFLLSYLWTPPIAWFGLCVVTLLFFLARTPKTLLVGVCSGALALAALAWPVNPLWNKVYSPYQLLEMGYGDNGLMFIRAAGHYYQRVHNLSEAAVQSTADQGLQRVRDYYDLPYRVHPGPNVVAIVGAGTGNDVAAALRSGAQHVDAIEIDPAILRAGQFNHPERPYSSLRVGAVVDDARSFFRNTSRKYDLIVYGLLDSHTLLSHASSVRLDSFVYTLEGLREARARLKDNGVLSLSFTVINIDLGTKIYQMMREAFDGNEPICIFAQYDGSVTFVQSKNGGLAVSQEVLSKAHFVERSGLFRNSGIKIDQSTDDWPFLYMPRRVYPVSYLLALGLVLLLSVTLYASFLREKPEVSHLPFFFLGAGFMLVETKAITEMGLTFGNTWQVIAIAIAGVLIMAFLANSTMGLLKANRVYLFLFYLLLLASLGFGWWIAKTGGLPSTTWGRIGTAALLTCPLFFSGLVFSALLSTQSRISSVMSLNLAGAMCGGILEYNSMYFGFRFLYLLGMGLYAAALLSNLALGRRSFPIMAGVQR